jgi:flavin reductase (DIM6/NTAB) family NADH-FMN oxidoreductase RutF
VLEVAPAEDLPVATEGAFKNVFARLVQGVAVVTTLGPHGPCGMTASSVTSLSLEPPLALVCFANASRTLAAVADSERFAVNVLKYDQREPSSAFARPRAAGDEFALFPFDTRHGVPVLRDTLAWAVCGLQGLVRAGDHTIAIGMVEDAGHDDGEPLLWHQGAYRRLSA